MHTQVASLSSRWQLVFGDRRNETLDWLLAQYQAPHRAYHNVEHLLHMFSLLDARAAKFARDEAVNLAIWFHDAVYVPQARDNEGRSIEAMREHVRGLGVSRGAVQRATRTIQHTCARPAHEHDPRIATVLDLDYAILASDADRYLRYMAEIRQECPWWLRVLYPFGRRAFVDATCARNKIFFTRAFEADEVRAKQNLNAERFINFRPKNAHHALAAVAIRDAAVVRCDGRSLQCEAFALNFIDEVWAYKVDDVITDSIRLRFRMQNNATFEIAEDALGASVLFQELGSALTNAKPFHEWYLDVVFPAFDACLTRVF